jgi:hypothetical protein
MSWDADAGMQGSAPADRRWTRWARLAVAAAIGLLFALPHLVRIEALGSYAAYSPFSAESPSAMVWDETFLYGAEANYTLTRHGAPAYDDTWEHHAAVYPYSLLPIELEAGLARLLGSLKASHLLISFLFPAVTALLLMAMFNRLGSGLWLAALLALLVLVLGFSARTLLLGDRSLLLHAAGARALDTLQGVRTPNPGMTFVQYLAALWCAAEALRLRSDHRRSLAWAVTGGIVGGLLFLSYAYYAIPWSATVAMLAALSLWRPSGVPRSMLAALAASIAATLPFLWWKHISTAQGNYAARSARLGLELGHGLRRPGLELTLLWGGFALLCLLLWLRLRTSTRATNPAATGREAWGRSLMTVILLAMAGALAALHMQVLTGFTIQSEFHLPHMVLQPLGFLLAGMVAAAAWQRLPRSSTNGAAAANRTAAAAFVLLYAMAAAAQFETARNSAALHRISASDAALFAWLGSHSATGAVVATDDLPLSVELPVMTHNSVLFAEGSRGNATSAELIERFLLASRLVNAPPARVQAELAQDTAGLPYATPVATYTYYLFESSDLEDRGGRRIAARFLPDVMAHYAALDPAAELRRFRVDFLWTQLNESPAPMPGWTWQPVLHTPDGTLWPLHLAP